MSTRHPIAGLALAAAAFLAAAVGGHAQEPVRIEGGIELPLTSSVSGETLRLLVWSPDQPAGPEGYAILYSFDGEESFALLTDIARSLNAAAARAGLPPVMVAAIAYPPGRASIARRVHDMTPAAETHVMPERPNGEPWPELGGGDAFLEMLERDAKPLVREIAGGTVASETLFGHSLGGLMVLERLRTAPGAFDCYVASSPSLWVNDRRMLLDMKASLQASRVPDTVPPHLSLSVGGAEQDLSPLDLRQKDGIEARRKWVTGNAMVTNARTLANIVKAAGADKLRLTYREYAGRNHQTARIVAALDAVETALGCSANQPLRP
jgi:predicted alpha/beta superfamily hydrolase